MNLTLIKNKKIKIEHNIILRLYSVGRKLELGQQTALLFLSNAHTNTQVSLQAFSSFLSYRLVLHLQHSNEQSIWLTY